MNEMKDCLVQLILAVMMMQTIFCKSTEYYSITRLRVASHMTLSQMSRIVSCGANVVFSSVTDSRGPGAECNKIVTRL